MGAGHPIIGSQRSVKSLYLGGYVNSGYLMLMLCPYKEVEAGLDVRSGHVIYDKWLLHFTSPTDTQMKNVGERRGGKKISNCKMRNSIMKSETLPTFAFISTADFSLSLAADAAHFSQKYKAAEHAHLSINGSLIASRSEYQLNLTVG